jgi:hypothetical protein
MTWSMPRPVLHWVGALLALTALGSFTMGVLNAPERGGRLPGERIPGQAAGGAEIVAPEATPLSQERIEAPPPPPKPEVKAEETAPAPSEATNATPGPLLNLPPATNTTPEEAAPPPNPEDEPPH